MTTVGVLARPRLVGAGPMLNQLLEWLKARGVRALVEERTAGLLDGAAPDVTVADGKTVGATADAFVVLGGDGTLLVASHFIERSDVPIVGVNFGNLGFLTEITLGELYPTLEAVLGGRYEYDDRRMLRAAIRSAGRPEAIGDVLNDVVIMKAAVSRIIELDVTVDGLFVSAFRADGLIVSSPTGSTAYNLAAGGPILHPSLPAVTITRSPRTLRLVKAHGRDHYEVLRTKLKWGESATRR
jgi:NAD+ kinase